MKKLSLIALAGLVTALYVHSTSAQTGPQSDDRVERILQRADINYEIDGDGDFKVIFDVGDGRSQLAIIRSVTDTWEGHEIREIWSIGYKSPTEQFSAAVANALLEDAFTNKLGAWGKQGPFAILVVRIPADADSDQFLSSLNYALAAADHVEEQLTGDTDEF